MPDLARPLALLAHDLRDLIREKLTTGCPAANVPLFHLFERVQAALGAGCTPDTFADMYAQTLVYHCVATVPRREASAADPLTLFYEPFLASYDPVQREQCSVYTTPAPVVSYIIRSLDHLLQTCFDRPDGLADAQTTILDPAAGTGTFLQAMVAYVGQRLQRSERSHEACSPDLAANLLPRLFGFEVLLAPCTAALLSLSTLLQPQGGGGMPGRGDGLCPHMYLTNALDGPCPALLDRLQEVRLYDSGYHPLVMVGNPPYCNYRSLNHGHWIRALLRDYKQHLHERKLNLDDDFIKFIRLGQWYISQAGQGIMAYITNNTYLDGITHRRMRQSLLETFSDIYVLNLHGNSKKKENCPDGARDENVFDIQQGVAIGLFVRRGAGDSRCHVAYAGLRGSRADKYAFLSQSDVSTIDWADLTPAMPYSFFVPRNVDGGVAGVYETWWKLSDIFPVQQTTIKTDRDSLFIEMDRAELEQRIRTFYTEEGLQSPFREAWRVENTSSYRMLSRRERTSFDPASIRRCLYRPFDVRWIYYAPQLTSRPAWKVMQHMLAGENIALLGMRQYDYQVSDYCYAFVTRHLTESRVFISNRGGASIFPLYCYPVSDGTADGAPARFPNLSPSFVAALQATLGLDFIPDGCGDLRQTIGPDDVLHYLYALLHSPTYRQRYADLLKIDFPRLPLTNDPTLFAALAARGARLVRLHLSPADGQEGFMARFQGEGDAGEPPLVERVTYCPPESNRRGRVMINRSHGFVGIDPQTWGLQIGGYQPLAKWLKDRTGHTLSEQEQYHYGSIAAALCETRHLAQEIDPWATRIVAQGLMSYPGGTQPMPMPAEWQE